MTQCRCRKEHRPACGQYGETIRWAHRTQWLSVYGEIRGMVDQARAERFVGRAPRIDTKNAGTGQWASDLTIAGNQRLHIKLLKPYQKQRCRLGDRQSGQLSAIIPRWWTLNDINLFSIRFMKIRFQFHSRI
jgi:hypothetical protein